MSPINNSDVRLSKSLCAVVGEVIASTGSHSTLEALFISAGAPGDPPLGSHHEKWKAWLFKAGQDPKIDSLSVLGNVLEEFMDLPPKAGTPEFADWKEKRSRLEVVLEENGLRYFRFGRVLPQGEGLEREIVSSSYRMYSNPTKPATVDELLEIIVRGLRRAMHPLTHRRKNAQSLTFGSEYDVQDLLHAMLRPWITDIRSEEFTPSYAGISTRMDFLLPAHELVIETKIIRDRLHAKKVGDELIIDIAHYRKHPNCKYLWCVIYDPENLIPNSEGLKNVLEDKYESKDGICVVKMFIL